MSFSRQLASVKTPVAASTSNQVIPGFNSNVDSWFLSASYAPRENLSFINSFRYSLADNFNDYTASAMPFGADYKQFDASLEMQWSPQKDITVGPKYAYYHYDANPNADTGNYNAHVAWLDLSIDW
jgi:hypothetical protein